jgi:dTMP kinase
MDKVLKIATDCLERVWPDLTIILNVDLQTASGRLNRQLDRIEQKGDSYHQRVREGFLQLAKQQENVLVVDAASDIETVHKKVIDVVKGF